MKKIFLTLAITVMALCANAQKNQYFWYQGNLMMGNPIAQIDSVTFGEGEPADTLHIFLPRTIIKTVHDTVYVTIHDTICPDEVTMHNGFRYVDLGLSVMWADANVGAENPEDYGNFFAWGEVTEKTTYNFNNYVHGNYRTATKYCDVPDQAERDNLTTLLPEDDAASVNMGGNWRIPSKAEWQELINNCIMTLDTISGYAGLRFCAPNGNSIFIPRAGNMWYSSHDNINTGVFYWTAEIYPWGSPDYEGNRAFVCTNQANNGGDIVRITDYNRCIGGSIRGVFSK